MVLGDANARREPSDPGKAGAGPGPSPAPILEMRHIAKWIAQALDKCNDDAALERIRGEVAELANRFPLYAWRRHPAPVNA